MGGDQKKLKSLVKGDEKPPKVGASVETCVVCRSNTTVQEGEGGKGGNLKKGKTKELDLEEGPGKGEEARSQRNKRDKRFAWGHEARAKTNFEG